MVAQNEGAEEHFPNERGADGNASMIFKAGLNSLKDLMRERLAENPGSREYEPQPLLNKTMAERDLTPAHLNEYLEACEPLVAALDGTTTAPEPGYFDSAVSGPVWTGSNDSEEDSSKLSDEDME